VTAAARPGWRERTGEVLIDLVVAVLGYAVLGLLGGFVWQQLVHLPSYTRTAQGAQMQSLGLGELFAINGWYCLIGGVLGLLAGAALMLWRHREPLWLLVCTAAASMLGAVVMAWFGQTLGPGEPADALRTAKAGATAPVQLLLQGAPRATGSHWYANTYLYAWLVGTLLGVTLVLLFVTPRESAKPDAAVSTHAGNLA